MPQYTVHLVNTVSTTVTVEADDPDAAIDAAWSSEDMPGSITIGAFGPVGVDDGDWQPVAVTDASGAEVWTSAEPA